MSDPTAVNNQITDAVTDINIKVLGDAPANAMGNLFQTASQAIQIAAHNATGNVPQTNETTQAATAAAISALTNLNEALPVVAPPSPIAPL